MHAHVIELQNKWSFSSGWKQWKGQVSASKFHLHQYDWQRRHSHARVCDSVDAEAGQGVLSPKRKAAVAMTVSARLCYYTRIG
jgi:hypothetical protein